MSTMSAFGTPAFTPVKNQSFGTLAFTSVKNLSFGAPASAPVENPSSPTANWNKIRVSPLQALNLDGPIVEICVGKEPQQKIFSVHQGLIAPRSEFFERAFNGNWKESESRLVNLPEDNVTIFGLYVQLLYTGRIPINNDDVEYITFSKLYVLCEKLQDIDAKNSILQALLAKIKELPCRIPGALAFSTIYHGTPENSPARKLLLDLCVERGNFELFRRQILEGCYPTEFVSHLAVELLKQRKFIGSETLANCNGEKYQEKVKEKKGDEKVEKIEVS